MMPLIFASYATASAEFSRRRAAFADIFDEQPALMFTRRHAFACHEFRHAIFTSLPPFAATRRAFSAIERCRF